MGLPLLLRAIEMKSQESQIHGLAWEKELFGSEPRWTLQPEIGAIKQTVQSLRPSDTVEVTFLAQGGFNKVYDVSIDDEVFIMRIALPVDPHYKTTSEVATMDWIRRITNLPIPRVITYQASRDNMIGFEWILMTKIPGKPFADVYRSLPFAAKERLVRKLAVMSACLFRNQLRGIGNIYGEASVDEHSSSSEQIPPPRELVDTKISIRAKESGSDDGSAPMRKDSGAPLFNLPDRVSSEGDLPNVGRIVSMQFFWRAHIHQDVQRGPFRSSKDWITAHLLFNENDCYSALDKRSAGDLDSDDEEEVEDATRTLPIIGKLRSLLPLVFPTDDDDSEPSMIFHHDLSRHNILVDDSGELTGLLDWECVSAVPLWMACNYPTFLKTRPRLKPDPRGYAPEENGEISEMYFEDLWDYEATLLRDVFLDEMRRLDAGWMEVFDNSEVKRDFGCAVQDCDSVISARDINEWIGDITAGVSNPRNLHQRYYGLIA